MHTKFTQNIWSLLFVTNHMTNIFFRLLKHKDFIPKIRAYGLLNDKCSVYTKMCACAEEKLTIWRGISSINLAKISRDTCARDSQTAICTVFVRSPLIIFRYKNSLQYLLLRFSETRIYTSLMHFSMWRY